MGSATLPARPASPRGGARRRGLERREHRTVPVDAPLQARPRVVAARADAGDRRGRARPRHRRSGVRVRLGSRVLPVRTGPTADGGCRARRHLPRRPVRRVGGRGSRRRHPCPRRDPAHRPRRPRRRGAEAPHAPHPDGAVRPDRSRYTGVAVDLPDRRGPRHPARDRRRPRGPREPQRTHTGHRERSRLRPRG